VIPTSDRKVIVVTRRTRLEELIDRFHTRDQAKFYVEHLGSDFHDYEVEHQRYQVARRIVVETLEGTYRHQFIDRSYLPNFVFGAHEVVMALGQDGLVANTLKYLDGQPLIGVNPDPDRNDGVLLPFRVTDLATLLPDVVLNRQGIRSVTMAVATLKDGQQLYAVNDLFIGPRSHTSLRYEISVEKRREVQSSSGLIVSTGLGSTGWMKSVVAGAAGIAAGLAGADGARPYQTMPWDTDHLVFAVREPFPSQTTQAALIFGSIHRGKALIVTSLTPDNGIVFSDGVEADYLAFTSGARAEIRIADRCGCLVAG
jgi:NAD kinase